VPGGNSVIEIDQWRLPHENSDRGEDYRHRPEHNH